MNTEDSVYVDTWKDVLLEVDIVRPNTDTGKPEAATGYTDIELALSATEMGAAISSGLSGFATERPRAPGRYYLVIDLATITSDLPVGTYADGTAIFVQVRKAGDIATESFRKVIRRKKY